VITLRPTNPAAAAVVLYVGAEDRLGTVSLDDPACVPAELGDDQEENRRAIDYFVDVAVEGRATAFHLGRGGAIEIRDGDSSNLSWHNAFGLPGWRRRATKVSFAPYRADAPRE
jgi:hypothetical protein